MTDPSPNGLNFGHFGAANYDLDNSKWTFDRNAQRQELSVLGQWRATIPAATSHTTPNLLRSSRTTQHAARELARDYAHLTPAVELLSRLEAVSAAATIATTAYDATIGSLLSFGSIACKGHSDHRPKPVVATTAGETGNILQLQVVEKERHGWKEHGQGICLEGPSLANGDRAYWNEDAAPIRQICFAEGEDRRTFLAARFPCRTVLFHPANVHRTKVSARSKYFDLPPSNIDPCPIHSIPMSATGGIPHADVSFNYEYQRQVGIVDERGQWSIWDIDDGYRTDNYTVTRSVFGDLTPNADGDSESSEQSDQTKEDGWARIFWCGDANTVVIANRRRLCIFNMKGGLTPLKSPRIISGRSADWILDVRRNPASKNHFFVLTSTQLYMVAVTCPSDDPGFDHVEPGSAIVLSWTHFRGMEDITLQLCVHVAPEHGMIDAATLYGLG
jgi:RNA polymerase I-specific transcription initiation factor RRN6